MSGAVRECRQMRRCIAVTELQINLQLLSIHHRCFCGSETVSALLRCENERRNRKVLVQMKNTPAVWVCWGYLWTGSVRVFRVVLISRFALPLLSLCWCGSCDVSCTCSIHWGNTRTLWNMFYVWDYYFFLFNFFCIPF